MAAAHDNNARMTRLLARPRLATLLLFACLSIVHTWPLASAPGRLSRNDNADTILNEWIVAWVQHQAPRDPAHLFDANIFYPEHRTLAYSEPLMVPAALGAPLRLFNASPVLVYNLLIIAGLTLTGWSGCLLVWRWTGDLAAGVVAGVVMAFNAHTLARLPQLQALHVEFLPLALLALDEMIRSTPKGAPYGPNTDARSRRTETWGTDLAVPTLAACVVLQGLTSYYALIFTLTALVVAWLVRAPEWWGQRRRAIASLGLAATAALVCLLPLLIPYARLGQVRSLDEVALYSAAWRDYLTSPARLHYDAWSHRFFGGTTALFPGVTALVLAGVALTLGRAATNPRARSALAFGVVGLALSFGPALSGYSILYRVLPPLQGIRNAARFGYLAIVALAILAGYGVAAIRARWPRARWTMAIVVTAFAAANLDAFSAPLDLIDAERVSPIHARLLGSDAVVAEFPFYPPDRVSRQAVYMLHATLHWRPMLNGYSGLIPESFAAHAADLARFPDAHAMATLRTLGVTHVFVHDRALRDWTDNETADAVPRSRDLHLLAEDGDVRLYAVVAGR
jgi:hypothetical protein